MYLDQNILGFYGRQNKSDFEKLSNEPLGYSEDSIYNKWIKDFKKEKVSNLVNCLSGLLFLLCSFCLSFVKWSSASIIAIIVLSFMIVLFSIGVFQEIKFLANLKSSPCKRMYATITESYAMVRERSTTSSADKRYRVTVVSDANNLRLSNVQILNKHIRRIPPNSRALVVAFDKNNIYAVPLHLYEY